MNQVRSSKMGGRQYQKRKGNWRESWSKFTFNKQEVVGYLVCNCDGISHGDGGGDGDCDGSTRPKKQKRSQSTRPYHLLSKRQ